MSEIYLEHKTVITPEVTLYISEEGARYIAQVMEEEDLRTRDSGARNIARNIREGLA